MINIPILHLTIPLIYFQLFLGLALSIAIIILSFILVVLLLDAVYRKDAKQYPKHILCDTLSPIVLLLAPSILVISLTHDSITLMDKFLLIICIHGFIIIPFIHFWSTHRKWDFISEIPLNSWNHPRIYLRIAIALIYPAIFGLYYTILRYLRIGQTIDIYKAFDSMDIQDIFPYIILSLFIWPFTSVWLRLFLWKFLDLRLFFWDEFSSLISLINIFLLKFNLYFKIMEIFYKISYIWISYFIHDPIVYPKWPQSYFRKSLSIIYRYPIIIYLIFVLGCLLELFVLKGKLFYTLYIIILLLLLRPFIYFLNHFNGLENRWVQACCYSDYVQNRWDKPRYPERFWLSFNDIREYLDNQPPMTKFLEDHIRIKIQIMREEETKNSHQILNEAYRKNSSRINRIKKGYHQWAQVRWVHTSKIITTAEPVLNKLWHPSTAVFSQTVFDYFALINNDWGHYKLIQQLDKKQRFLYPKNLYNDYFTGNIKTIAEALEKNLVTNFTTSKNYNILVQTYNKHVKLDTAGQAEPDIFYDMKNNHVFIDKRTHGLDQKSTQAPRALASNMFSNVSLDQYDVILREFNRYLNLTFYDIGPEKMRLMQEGLIQLKNSAHDFSTHQIVFASVVHLYPNSGIPPLRLPHNFAISDLTKESLLLCNKSNIKMKRVSDLLYIKKVSRHNTKEAEKLFQDSEMQRILTEEEADHAAHLAEVFRVD